MLKDFLDVMTVVVGILAVFSLAPISVGIMYLVEESFKNTVNSIFNLFENNHGGVEL